MKANPPDIETLITEAEAGDRLALERLYGHAVAWLRDGKAPPEPQATWLAARLHELCGVLANARRKDPSEIDAKVAKAMRVRRGRPGRPPAPAYSKLPVGLRKRK